MKFTRRFSMAIPALLICQAMAPELRAQSYGATAIQGAWSVDIDSQDTPDFHSFVTYSAGGTTVEHNGAPGGSGPATGTWEFLGAGEFGATWLKPIWNPQTGTLIATVEIRARIRMISADQYESHDKVEVYLPDGTLVLSTTAVQTGKRIKVEPVNW